MCSRPLYIDGVKCRCGQCEECRAEKARAIQLVLQNAIEHSHGNAVFLTMTFAAEKLDYVEYRFAGLGPQEMGETPFKPVYSYELDPFGKVQHSLRRHLELHKFRKYVAERLSLDRVPEVNEVEDEWYKVISTANPNTAVYKHACLLQHCMPSYNAGALIPCFPKCSGDSIQRYWKRVRKALTKRYRILSENPKATQKEACDYFGLWYYAVQEYGPRTFWPHWHMVVGSRTLSKEHLEELVNQVLKKVWQRMYGNVDYAGVVRESCGLAKYVSKYISKPSEFLNPYAEAGIINRASCTRFHSTNLAKEIKEKLRAQFSALADEYRDVVPEEFHSVMPKGVDIVREEKDENLTIECDDLPNEWVFSHKYVSYHESCADYSRRCKQAFEDLDNTRYGEFMRKLYDITHYAIEYYGQPVCSVSFPRYMQAFWPKVTKRYRLCRTESEKVNYFTGEVQPRDIIVYVNDDDDKNPFEEDDLPLDDRLLLLTYPFTKTVRDTTDPIWASYKAYCELRSIATESDDFCRWYSQNFEDCPTMVDFDEVRLQYRKAVDAAMSARRLSTIRKHAHALREVNLERSAISDVIS